MVEIRGRDVRPGDAVEHGGACHVVRHVDQRDGWAWPVAFDDAGWALALGDDRVVVHRAEPGDDRLVVHRAA